MSYLPRIATDNQEEAMEKLDKVTNTIGEKVKDFVKFFFVAMGWLVLNVIIAVFFNRTHSMYTEVYKILNDSVYQVASQDLSIIIVFFLESKFSYAISVAMVFACSVVTLMFVLYGFECMQTKSQSAKYDRQSQSVSSQNVYVVSYKQHVAFLA